MSSSRRLSLPVLAAALLVPSVAYAQDEITLAHWSYSDDGQLFATAADGPGGPDVLLVDRPDFPAPIADLPGADVLYGVGEPFPAGGVTVVGLHDAAQLDFASPGQTPVSARARAGETGSSWVEDQQIVSVPDGCLDALADDGRCVHDELIARLLGLSGVDDDSAEESTAFLSGLAPGRFVSVGTTDQPGTFVNFAGDSTVMTSVKVKDDGTVVVRGTADIGPGLGGRLRGFDATLIEVPTDPDAPLDLGDAFFGGTLDERRAILRETKAKPNKANRVVFDCPASGQAYVVDQFFIGGFARGTTVFLGDDVEGGAPVVVTEILPVACGHPRSPGSFPTSPGEGPAASLRCLSMEASHTPFTSTQDGSEVEDASSVRQRVVIVTVGVPPGEDLMLGGRLGGANGGAPYSVGLEGIQLDSVMDEQAVLWLGEAEVGINRFGPKPIRALTVEDGFGRIDLTDQAHAFFGDAFDVTASEEPVGDCPDLLLADLPDVIFEDGFESGDISAWSHTRAD